MGRSIRPHSDPYRGSRIRYVEGRERDIILEVSVYVGQVVDRYRLIITGSTTVEEQYSTECLLNTGETFTETLLCFGL